MRLLFGVPALLALVDCSSSSSSNQCTMRECVGEHPQLWTSVNTDVAVVDLAGGSVRVCRETVCTESPFDGTTCAGRTGGFTCRVETTHNIGMVYVDFATAPPKNGERFEVTVLAPAGTAVGVTGGTAVYTEKRPNGPTCDPICISGELEIDR